MYWIDFYYMLYYVNKRQVIAVKIMYARWLFLFSWICVLLIGYNAGIILYTFSNVDRIIEGGWDIRETVLFIRNNSSDHG